MTVFKKSLLTLGLAAFCFSAVFVISILAFMNSLYYEINTTRLKDTAVALMTAIGKERVAVLFADNAAASMSENINLPVDENSPFRLTLIMPSGYVLWDSHVAGRLVNHIDRSEIIAALEGREASARRNSLSANMKLIYYALPVFDGENNVAGVFRLSLSIPGFGTRLSGVLFPLTIFAVFMITAVFAAIFAFSRSLSTSIKRLVNIIQAGAPLLTGEESEKETAPEFQSLEKALRAMTRELSFRVEQATAEGQRLEAILNGMSEAVFAMDSSLKLHLVNPRAKKLFNLEERDTDSMTLLEATHSVKLTEIAAKALVEKTTLEAEISFQDGEQQFQIVAAPLPARTTASTQSENASGGVVLVLQEITRLVKLERVRKDFVANVSHELRTPIQLIKGFSETLLDTVSESNEKDRKQIIHSIEIIHKNAATMENLTNDLLTLADLENNSNRSINGDGMEEINVKLLIDEAVSSLERIAKNKKIEIITECSDELKAKLHGAFIVQALVNMIENAVKFSPDKSKIWVSAYLEAGKLVLQVKDTGIGIPAEHIDRIFERFYRVDRSRSREAGGTGLGLSIVRHIALLHNGTAEVESRLGEGSCFRLKLPV